LNLSFGASIFGNGGMNMSYKTPVPLFGARKPGGDLSQLFVAPTAGDKRSPDHA
jgi:long-chain fatty acid transport protein